MRWVQMFEEGTAEQRDLLGGKGANLAEMTRMGLPVPPGFTVTTDACRAFMAAGDLPDGLVDEVGAAIATIEERLGRHFGDPSDPLLLSVRSGARFSMPGMMDTVLNLGLDRDTVKGLATRTGDERFALDAWRRLLDMFGRVVLDVPGEALGAVREVVLGAHGVADPSDLDTDGLRELADGYEQAVERHTGAPFPMDPHQQLRLAIEAVFRSWNGRRARDYRQLEHIPDDLGTAVNIQAMVFGNAGPDSATGVAFTRDPATGRAVPYGDFLVGAQGEDVVAGIRHTLPLASMRDHFPQCADELAEIFQRLEERYRDMCDVEFTIERGRLFMLQTRVGKRSAEAALRIAVEMADEELIDHPTALQRFSPTELERLLHPRFDPSAEIVVATTGLAASPGAASGQAVFTADEAVARAATGVPVVLVRPETSPDDLHGMIAATGILTTRGGLVSHAAVVARGIGRPAVCGAAEVEVDLEQRRAQIGEVTLEEGDIVSIDGTSGQVVIGEVPVVAPETPPELARLLAWADDARRLGVRANADTAEDAARARAFGAEGIGLCRTEHQFLGDRLPVVQRAILAETDEERESSLAELHDVQLADFTSLLEAMDGLPVTVRLLDPPLHEFLPKVEDLLVAQARGELDEAGQAVLHAARSWAEANPMLGIRGVRLGLLLPALYRMQVRALTEAAVARRRAGGDPRVQVMIPLVSEPRELAAALTMVRQEVERATAGEDLDVHVGTMVETPRGAILAGDLAGMCDFLSFGTNDLTQMTWGFSRDDVEARLMPRYLADGIIDADPFQTLDTAGVGLLMRQAVAAARDAAEVEIGICGEHGGDPASIAFCHELGFDYVSCSPFRVLVARLAAARAAIDERSDEDR